MTRTTKKKNKLIPLKKEEIDDWYYNRERNLILDIQKRIFYRAMDRILEAAPEDKREEIKHVLEYEINGYPIARNDGGPDHPVFLPKKYRQEKYYDMVMGDIYRSLGDQLFPLFRDSIEEGINDLSIQIEPRFEELRNVHREYAKKYRRIIGRWHLNQLEKSLVKSRTARLEGDTPSLKLQKKRLSAEERDSVTRIVRRFFRGRKESVSQQALDEYIEVYSDMKTYLQLVPYFVDDLFQRFDGSLIFLDRDARPLYEGAKIFKKHRQERQSLYLVPVTRAMIPDEYTEAHHKEKGSMLELVKIWASQREQASYSWRDERTGALEEKEKRREMLRKVYGDNLTLERAIKNPDFEEKAGRLYSFLKHIRALRQEQVTAIDMGLLGTASDFTADVIRHYSPEKITNSYLFFSYSKVDGFIRDHLPHLGLDCIDYIIFYESFPKSVPMVEGFKRKGNVWFPKYERLTNEESKWIRGIEGEVFLGEMLVEEAVRNSSMQYLFDKPKSEQMKRQIE